MHLAPSIIFADEGGELELPVLPSTYFECQRGMGEWIDKAETFSPSSKARFQQWAKGTQICLAEGQLQEESYRAIQSKIQEQEKRKTKSRRSIQAGGMISVEGARKKRAEKDLKEKTAAIKKARKDIQVAVNKAMAALHRRGVDARKAERERKNQVQNILTQGGIPQSELLIPITDPEKNPSPEDLESLQTPPDLLQALLMLDPSTHVTPGTSDVEIITGSSQVQQRNIEIGGSPVLRESDCEDLGSESDSNSSCTSSDSIMRNADFVTFN